jgi:CRISPR/Cas system-associated exonuclease Cas4 (RecB family)
LNIYNREPRTNLSKWEQQLEEYTSLLKQVVQKPKKGELRFDNSCVRASDVASQYYCEKKVEMQYLYGEIETETKNQGTEAHEKLLEGSEEVSRQNLWKKIHGKRPVFALELLLLAKYKGLILAGRPDCILFEKGFPLIIFEYKFSRSQRDYLSYHVQARTYGILLKNMGFDISKLFYAIVVADHRAKDDDQLKARVVDTILKNRPKDTVLTTENAVIYLNKFNPNEAELALDWAIEFWKGQREATQTMNPNKCRSCEYNADCERQST